MPEKTYWSRRRFIAGISAIGVTGSAGCSSDEQNNNSRVNNRDGVGKRNNGEKNNVRTPVDSDNDGVPDQEDDYPNDSSRSRMLDSGANTYDLNEDYYHSISISPSQPAILSYRGEVIDGGIAVDFILLDDMNFQYFKDESEWEYSPDGSDMDAYFTNVETQLQSGDYHLIIDNTDEGGANPPMNLENDRVEVKVEYELFV